MANALFELGREAFLDSSVNYSSDTIKVALIDLDTTDIGNKLVTGATNATPIVVTSTSHGFSNGDVVTIKGVTGNTNANGIFKIANVATNTFELTDYNTGVNIAGNGTFGGTAYAINMMSKFWDKVDGGLVGTAQTLASKTVTQGVADAADVTFSAVSGATVEALIIYKDTGTNTTSRVVAFIDTATGLPVTPNGGDITVQWDNGSNRIFKL